MRISKKEHSLIIGARAVRAGRYTSGLPSLWQLESNSPQHVRAACGAPRNCQAAGTSDTACEKARRSALCEKGQLPKNVRLELKLPQLKQGAKAAATALFEHEWRSQ